MATTEVTKVKLHTDELAILLNLHKNSYDHVRAMLKARSSYFNFYILVIGIAFAAYSQIYDPLVPFNSPAILLLSALVYFISIFTMMRAERLTGHIAHDLHAIRRAQNIFASSFPRTAGDVSPFDPDVSEGVSFDRHLLDRNRSVEAPSSILGGIASAIAFSLATGLPCWSISLLSIGLGAIPYILWAAEVRHLKTRHQRCCIRTATEQGASSAAA